jgi:hypothetical protein
MKYIKFTDEVMRVPKSVTFWVMARGDDYACPYCVNMSPLEPQNFIGEPSTEGLIRSEGYKTREEAHARLDELLDILNQ